MVRLIVRILLPLLILPAIAHAQALPSVDAVVDNETIGVRLDCGVMELGEGFVTRVDADGNGRDDLLLDFSEINCDGSQTRYCSVAGCGVAIYLQDADGQFSFLGKFQAMNVSFDRPNAMWPSFLADIGGPGCDKGPFQTCLQRFEIRHGVLWQQQRR
jgi:hypothetical protein